jgi:phage recombination protein Bet
MSTELTVVDKKQSVMAQYTNEQMKIITDIISPGLTNQEMILFLATAQRMGLDPLQKQIYSIKYGGKMSLVVSIDGYRARAAETGEHVGTDDAVFEYEGAGRKTPIKATVTVWKMVNGQKCAFSASARWDEYCPSEKMDRMWRKMPHTMLAKCSEALALRKAFSRLLDGTYTEDEKTSEISYDKVTGVVDTEIKTIEQPAPEKKLESGLTARIVYEKSMDFGMSKNEFDDLCRKHKVGKDPGTHTQEALSAMLDEIKKYVPAGFVENEDSEPDSLPADHHNTDR